MPTGTMVTMAMLVQTAVALMCLFLMWEGGTLEVALDTCTVLRRMLTHAL